MAADGSRGPKPWKQNRATTIFLRVPRVDWPAVKIGAKREFRAGTGRSAVPQLWGLTPPLLVVAYSIDDMRRHDGRLMLLEEHWREPLGAISDESLRAEGHDSLASFREYWMLRERRRFTPTREVSVYRVAPADDCRLNRYGMQLLHHLYGEWL